MTVIIVGQDDLSGDLVLASDRLSALLDESTGSHRPFRHDAIKSLRINDTCAVACGGFIHFANWFYPHLFNRLDLLGYNDRMDVSDILEREGAERPDLDLEGSVQLITSLMDYFRHKSRTFHNDQLSVLLAGADGHNKTLMIWLKQNDWKPEVTSGTIVKPKTTPEQDTKITRLLTRPNTDMVTKAIDAIAYCAQLFPSRVNSEIIIRRLSNCFRKEEFGGAVEKLPPKFT